MSRIYDVAVIGAGVIGAAVSYFTALDGADAVSYTHLDVYKRQGGQKQNSVALLEDRLKSFPPWQRRIIQ